MSEPIARRKSLVDYRISATRCENCGRVYFPPKSFCDREGRASKMSQVDYFYKRGVFYTGAVVNTPTNKFEHLGSLLTGIIEFPEEKLRVPGRITDYTPPSGDVEVSKFIGRNVVPRFRRLYADGESGLIYYSSMNFTFDDEYYPYQEYSVSEPAEMPGEEGKPGIVSYGVYIPKFRIRNEGAGVLGVRERTLPFADEDTTTFSVEAGKRALIHAAVDARHVKKCFVGSESSPYAVKPIMATVAQVLELGEKYEDGFFSGGVDTQFACKAATDLFIDAAALVAYPVFNGKYVMVIGTDNSQAAPGDPLDYTVGAGAVAYLFGRRDVIATLDHYVPYTSDTPDFYRRQSERYPRHGGRFTGEPAYFKHVVTAMKRALKETNLKPSDISYVVCHCPNATFPSRAAIDAGFERKQIEPGLVVASIGNLYSGSSPAGLAAVLDFAKPSERILVTSYGSGSGSESYLFTVTEQITEKRGRSIPVKAQIENPHKQYVDYHTYRKWKELS